MTSALFAGCAADESLPLGDGAVRIARAGMVEKWHDFEAPDGSKRVYVTFVREDGTVDANADTSRLESINGKVRVVTADGTKAKAEVWGYANPDLFFVVPDGSSGLKLEWPKRYPVDLQPYLEQRP